MNKRNIMIAGLTSCLLLGGALNIFAYAADNNKSDTTKPNPILTADKKDKTKIVLPKENVSPAKTVDYTIEVSDNSSSKKITKESVTNGPMIKASVTWNGITYKVNVPTYGVNDKTKKDYDYIQSRIGKHLGSDFYEIKGIDIKKSIAYKVWKYYYKCDAIAKK